MLELITLIKGIAIGLVIALPSGPVGFICLRRIFTHGKAIGFISGVGTSLGDAIYAFIAALGLTAIAAAHPGSEQWITIAGGAILVIFGLKIALSRPLNHTDIISGAHRLFGSFCSAFALTIANPSIIFSFAALFAGLGLTSSDAGYPVALSLSSGILLGSCTSWFLVSRLEQTFREKITPAGLRRIDIIIGCIVIGFGCSGVFSAL